MAWYFMASVECGAEREAAEAVSIYFDKLSISLPDGFSTTCWSSTSKDAQENWWSNVTPRGTSYGAFAPMLEADGTKEYEHDERLIQTDEQMNNLTLALYSHLKRAPPYRYALVGNETEHFWEINDIMQIDMSQVVIPGLILNEDIWRLVGEPANFVSFHTGYVWQPHVYRGIGM